MSNVLIDREKIDILANAISDKSGVPVTMTLAEMVAAVDGIETGGGEPNLQAKTYTVNSAGTGTVTADSGYDGLSSVTVSVPQGEMFATSHAEYYTENNSRKWRFRGEARIDTYDGDGTPGFIANQTYESGSWTTFNAIPKNTTVAPSTSAQTIGGTNYMMEGAVTVNAIPPATVNIGAGTQYVTTGGVRKWECEPFIQELIGDGGFVELGPYERIGGTTVIYNAIQSGTTVTPTTSSQTIGGANYMMEGPVTVSAMPSGSARPAATITGTAATVSTGTNTLTLTKIVSNTPQVTAGYVASGTAGNSSVSLTANVTTQAAQTIYPSGSDQTIASARYLTGTQTIKAVTTSNLTAENIKNGVTVTVGDSADADRVLSVTGTYTGGGGGDSKNAQVVQQGNTRIASTTYSKACGDITVSKTGTYDVYWSAYRTSTSGTWGTQLYISGVAYGSAQATFSSYYQTVHLSNVSLTANQTVSVYGRSRGSNYYLYVGQLSIIEA